MALLQAAGLGLGQALSYMLRCTIHLSHQPSPWEKELIAWSARVPHWARDSRFDYPNIKVNLGRGRILPSREN